MDKRQIYENFPNDCIYNKKISLKTVHPTREKSVIIPYEQEFGNFPNTCKNG
jgi:hypothetical protein